MSTSYQNRRQFLKACSVGIASIALSGKVSSLQAAVKTDKPNIILFLTDDQGWADTSVEMMKGRADTKSDLYQTPNLERMAKDGMVFSSGYSSAPQCAPTRGSIQFGKTPARLRQTKNGSPTRDVTRENEVAIGKVIKAADSNYATGHFGKWMVNLITPEEAGYDESDGVTGNGNGNTHRVNGERVLFTGRQSQTNIRHNKTGKRLHGKAGKS